jgi:hypothetical protein
MESILVPANPKSRYEFSVRRFGIFDQGRSRETALANLKRIEIRRQKTKALKTEGSRVKPSGRETVNYSMTERLPSRQIPNAKHARLPEEA